MPTSTILPEERLNHPRTRGALRGALLLVGGYLTLSAATLVAIILLRNNPAVVTEAVWIRGTIVVASAVLMLRYAQRAAAGVARAYLRVRLLSAIMVVAIVVIIALPGTFPLWMKIEQGACGLLLLGVVVLLNGSHLRAQFARG